MKDGVVYFVSSYVDGEDGAMPVKVGYSTTPHKRLRELNRGSPVELYIEAALLAPPDAEFRFHQRYAAHHSHGEWFRRSAQMIADIKAIEAGTFSLSDLAPYTATLRSPASGWWMGKPEAAALKALDAEFIASLKEQKA